jgi:hypothetical protein
MRDTVWTLSEICREVTRSSLMVVDTSLRQVAASRAPVACLLAVVRNSAEELCTCCTAVPIWRESARVSSTAVARANNAVATVRLIAKFIAMDACRLESLTAAVRT